MTLVFEHTSEGAVDEADVGTGAGFGTPWATISKVGGATVKYDTAHAMHGSRSMRFSRVVASDTAYARAALGVAVARLQARVYVWIDAQPTSQLNIIRFRNASGFMADIALNLPSQTAGRLGALNSTGAGINASLAPADFPLSQWVRIEAAVKKGTGTTDGTIEFAYYLGDSTTAVHSYSTAVVNTGTADPIEARLNFSGSTAVPVSMWADDFALGDASTGWLGPAIGNPPSLGLTGNQNLAAGATATVTATATDDGTIASYAWSVVQPSTTTPTLTGATTATVTFTTPAIGNLVTLQCIVTDDQALTATATTEVRVPRAGSASVVPLAVDATKVGTITRVGGSSTDGAALADASDGTYLETATLSATEQSIEARWEPTNSRATGQMTPIRLGTDTGTGTALVKLVEGTTVRQSWTQAITSTATDYTFTLDPATITAIADWGNLRVRVGFTT